jgi:hypothetical protein
MLSGVSISTSAVDGSTNFISMQDQYGLMQRANIEALEEPYGPHLPTAF